MGRKVKIFTCIAITVLVLILTPTGSQIAAKVEKLTGSEIMIIDPGHGGFDGGAEDSTGTPEKDINLAISLEIKKLAEADGWRVEMTRDTDKALSGDQKASIRSKKTQDLKARKELIDRISPVLTISIHLNSFYEDRSVHGAQVFYPDGNTSGETESSRAAAEAKILAETIQQELTEGIADGTNRTALTRKGMMIFKNIKAPIVLVECGFLSNTGEAELLKTVEYQRKLAECIYKGIMHYSGKEPLNIPKTVDSNGKK